MTARAGAQVGCCSVVAPAVLPRALRSTDYSLRPLMTLHYLRLRSLLFLLCYSSGLDVLEVPR